MSALKKDPERVIEPLRYVVASTDFSEPATSGVARARADDRKVDLIAMGTHGAGAIERLFLGTVAGGWSSTPPARS